MSAKNAARILIAIAFEGKIKLVNVAILTILNVLDVFPFI